MTNNSYKQKLNPSRGFMIEKFHPMSKQDVELAKYILDIHDELVIGIGSTGKFNEQGMIMSAGERVDLVDYVLKAEGINPNRYVIIPIENSSDDSIWVGDTVALCPKWDAVYTRNYKNATKFDSFADRYGISVERIDDKKTELDFYGLLAESIGKGKVSKNARNHLPEATLQRLDDLGIFARINNVYNRENVVGVVKNISDRVLFLGGFQPFTGVYADKNGHMSNVLKGLELGYQVVIGVGSGEVSKVQDDPLTAGERIDVLRYSLIANGVDASNFFTIPIKNISSNECFPNKVISLSPKFNFVIAGNDWTKLLFGKGNYGVLPVERSTIRGTNLPISGTKVRNIFYDNIKSNHSKDTPVSKSTIKKVESELELMLDTATLKKLKAIGMYDVMHFLTFGRE